MSKTDHLAPIGGRLTTYDYQAGVCRTWRVTGHGFAVGRVVEMVVLESTEAISQEQAA